MKKIFLILSIVLLGACKASETYPDVSVIIIDLANVQCRYYKLVDKRDIKFDGPTAYHNLYKIKDGKTVPNEMCEGAIGYLPREFKKVQNWARDIQD